jgi:hypothetical protein
MKLSIFLAGIRTQNWKALYDSIPNATSLPESEYEVIFVGPHGLPAELQDKPNVKFIEDWGSPMRCYQIGLLEAKGEYVTWIADDGVFSVGLALDKGFEIRPQHDKGIVAFKYIEGFTAKDKEIQQPDTYWSFSGHSFLRKKCKYTPLHYKLLLLGLMKRQYMFEIGGFDCSFEQPGMGCNDFATRVQNDGAEVILGDRLFECGHERGGEHSPIDDAHLLNDRPLFLQMYNNPENSNRTRIDIHNWKSASAVWERRYKR